jgi:hypothetical protein
MKSATKSFWFATVVVCILSMPHLAVGRDLTKTQELKIACGSGNPGCKDEKCTFQNQIDITTEGKEISKITIKWRKSSSSQCCKPDRKYTPPPQGAIVLTYTDSSKEMLDGNNRWAKGIKWLSPTGDEVSQPAKAPDEPSGLVFDKGTGPALVSIDITYPMNLMCDCLGETNKAANSPKPIHWITSASYNAGDEEIKVNQNPKE